MKQIGHSALIGHTGFVGGVLRSMRSFDVFANSRTIGDLARQSFDIVVCAGVSAVKWQANKEPEADWAGIARLISVLETVAAREFVLISTIDVYPTPAEPANEDAVIDPATNHAYGRHRLLLERWVCGHFQNVRVLRLPALFGPGLKKNVLFDLMHGNRTETINPASSFQWYPLSRLVDDIDLVHANGIDLVNLVPEPLQTADLLAAFFPAAVVGKPVEPAPSYRLETKHARVFGGRHGWIADRNRVLGELGEFIAANRDEAP